MSQEDKLKTEKNCQECVTSPGAELADAAGAAASPPETSLSELFTKSFHSLLGVKNGMFFGGTSTVAPVFGLRPIRPRRCRVRKLPKPRISILSPVCSAEMMESNIVSTMASDSFRGNSVIRMTSSTRSALVMVASFIHLTPRELKSVAAWRSRQRGKAVRTVAPEYHQCVR